MQNRNEQLELPTPRRRRRRLPDTSHAAEAKAKPFSQELRDRIHAALQRAYATSAGGATASELAEELCEPVLNVRRRLSELHRREARAKDAGFRRTNRDGNPEVVWRPVLDTEDANDA